jgi:serine/threonine-protein kinase ATR
MEVCLQLLRQNKDVLLSVLEPFLRDPTVAWSRSGRAQRSEASSSTKSTATFHDRENADAKEALLKISGRLNGVYNIVNPAAEDIKREYRVREKAYPNRGLGASKDEELPLSVSGQVQRLISEAIMEENLAQMFIGKFINIQSIANRITKHSLSIGWQPWM